MFTPLTLPSQRCSQVPVDSYSSVSAGVEQQRRGHCQLLHLVPLPLVTFVPSLRIPREHTELGPLVPFHVESVQLVLKLICQGTLLCQRPYEVTLALSCSSSVQYSNNNILSGIPGGSVTACINHLRQTHHSPTHSASQQAAHESTVSLLSVFWVPVTGRHR